MFAVFPNLKGCLCCVSLKWGTIFFAMFYTVASVPLFILFVTPFIRHKLYGEDVPLEDNTIFFNYMASLVLFLHFITGCVILIAAFRESPDWMVLWIFVSFFQSAALVFLAMVCTVIYVYQVKNGDINDNPEEAAMFTIYAFYGFLLYYAASVANSYKKQLYAETRAARNNFELAERAPLSAA